MAASAEHVESGYDAAAHEEHCRGLCPIDLGSDHAIGWTPSGDLYWLHRCTDPNYYSGEGRWAVGTIDVTSGQRHTLRKRLPVDVGGSVLCVGCRDHGFINDGRWVKAWARITTPRSHQRASIAEPPASAVV